MHVCCPVSRGGVAKRLWLVKYGSRFGRTGARSKVRSVLRPMDWCARAVQGGRNTNIRVD